MPSVLRSTPDVRELSVALELFLYDAFTGSGRLAGPVVARLAGRGQVPLQKRPEAAFAFFGLPPGDYVVRVRSDPDAPYYQDADIPVTLPFPDPRWPAFPDHLTLADLSRPLDDPRQTAEFLAERQRATLRPTTAYPFPPGATLVRGTVRAGGAPLAGATVGGTFEVETEPGVVELRQAVPYVTAAAGEYVLFFNDFAQDVEAVRVEATHPNYGAAARDAEVRHGTTAVVDFEMAP
jgi:hypothetical protein